MEADAERAIAEVDQLVGKGEWIAAFDLASRYLATFPENELLKHRAVLALARAGATDRAMQHFRDWKLDRSENTDVQALEGRLLKDHALKQDGAPRRAGLLAAAAAYKRIFDRKPAYYPAINWASLTFLGGRKKEAAKIARRVLADPDVGKAADFWSLATRAEANILVGDIESARRDLKAARAFRNEGGASSTRRQLRLLLAEAGHTPAEIERFLAPLAPRVTLHYFSDESEAGAWKRYRADGAKVRAHIDTALKKLNPGAVFGSLGSPGEIVFAEAALAAGKELNVILSLPAPLFAAVVLKGAGKEWRARFEACCAAANRLDTIAEEPDSDDPGLGEHAGRVAMGLALQRAQNLDGKALQVILTDSASDTLESPLAAAWSKDRQRKHLIVDLRGGDGGRRRRRPPARQCSALVFGDLPGFSRMPEKYLPVFWATVMGAIGDVLAAKGDAVALKNTWGDAIHLVVPDIRTAAEICLAVQERLAEIDGSVMGREEAPTMRIGAHYGPVYADWDPVVGKGTFYGRSLSRAARIEPITPPGAVFVTEAFAAVLLLETKGEFTCNYVGQVPLAKGYGTFRMYDLKAEGEAAAVKKTVSSRPRSPAPSTAPSPRRAGVLGRRREAARRSRT